MAKRASATVIGAFVVGAIVLAVAGVTVFGSGRLFRKTYKWVCYFQGSVNGLRVGAPVKFKGVEIGAVSEIALNLSQRQQRPDSIRIPVIIEIDSKRITEKGGRVTMDEAGVRAAVEQGLRAQLNTESFVTGVLYVELDFLPNAPMKLVHDPDVTYPEVPTLPTTLEQVQTKASEIINALSEADIRGLAKSAGQTIDGLNVIINSPGLRAAVDGLDETMKDLDSTAVGVRDLAKDLRSEVAPLGKSLRSTTANADAALAGVQRLVEPGSPLTYQLGRTLQDLGEAARAVRALAELLERNPSALLRGRPVPQEGR